MTVGGADNRARTQQFGAQEAAKRTETPKRAEVAQADVKPAASDSFVGGTGLSGFSAQINRDAIKQAASGLKDLGKKLIDAPGVKDALGAGDPSKVLDAARDFAKATLKEKLASAEFNLPSGEKGLEKGKNLPEGMDSKAFVEKGLQGGELGIKPTTSGSKEVAVSKEQKAGLDKAAAGLGKVQDGFEKAAKLAQLAETLGIPVPKAEKTAEVGASKTLASSADGKHKVTLDASAKGSASAGVDGLKAEGEAKAGVTASSTATVGASNKYGDVSATYNATATAGASAKGKASLGADGLKATGELQVGITAKVEGAAKIESKPLGGIEGLTAGAEVKGNVEVGANAYAKGEASLTAGPPPKAIVEGTAGAYAGIRASAEASVSVGPVVVKGEVQGWVGVGAEVKAKAGYSEGKLSFDFSAGAALGYGGSASWGFTLDLSKVEQLGGKALDKLTEAGQRAAAEAMKVADADGDGKLSIEDAKLISEKVGKAVENAAQGMSKGVNTAVAAVGKAAETFAEGVKKTAETVGKDVKKTVETFAEGVKKTADVDGDGKLTLNDAKAAGDKIAQVAQTGVLAVEQVAKQAFVTVAPVVNNAAKTVVNAVNTVAQTVAPVINTAAQNFVTGANTAAKTVVNVANTAAKTIATGANTAAKTLVNVANTAVQEAGKVGAAAVNTVKTAPAAVANFANNAVKGIGGFFSGLFGG